MAQIHSSTDDHLPSAFRDRLARIVPAERLNEVMAAFAMPPVTAFRINTLRADRERVLNQLLAEGIAPQSVAWLPEAFYVPQEDRQRLLESRTYREGGIYVQNLSSMIPVLLLDPQPGDRVLDLAAAPGSKTLQIAGGVGPDGEVAAVEVVRSRFFKLRENLRHHGATGVRTFLKNGEEVWRFRPEHFDRVLLDAPCSTEGRFTAEDAESVSFWSPRKVTEMAGKQRRLLFSAVQALRPGGVLVYSTCTFAPEENEAALDDTLTRFGEALSVEQITLDGPPLEPPLESWEGQVFRKDVRHARRIYPSALMEGFFVAKLVKTESTLGARPIGRR